MNFIKYCLSSFFCFVSLLVYAQSETQLKTQLKKDPVFIQYNKARLSFITGVVENKWGNLTADKAMLKNINETEHNSYNEVKNLYKKAGVDSGYLIALNKMLTYKVALAKKYKNIIKSKPEMWKKVTKDLTSDVPKPLPNNIRSQH